MARTSKAKIERGEYKLSIREQKFVAYYIEYGDATKAVKEAGFETNAPIQYARKLLGKAKIQQELKNQLEGIKNDAIASTTEIMCFYTKAMRGEIKDQFGIEATLADRMKAADALAKRQIDMQAIADRAAANEITVNLNWSRQNDKVSPDLPTEEDLLEGEE
jgi:phage terminase small subunit